MSNYSKVECKACIGTEPGYSCHQCNGTKEVQDPKTILCNLCAKSMCYPDEEMNSQIPYGLLDAEAVGSYSSQHLSDCTIYRFSLCELCLRKLFVECKIKPALSSYMSAQFSSFEEENEVYEYSKWYRAGGPHKAYLDGMCNITSTCVNKAEFSMYDVDGFTETACCKEHKNHFRCNYAGTELKKFLSKKLRNFLG